MICVRCCYEPELCEGVLGRTAGSGQPAAWKCPECGNWTPYDAPATGMFMQKRGVKSKLTKLAEELDAAPRQGAEKDSPEGARYVTISDTALKNIVEVIRQASADPEVASAAGVPIGIEYLARK